MSRDQTFRCHWCGASFARRHRVGRRPLYCAQTCRQRCYEHRRRAAFEAGLPAVPAVARTLPGPPAYEMGRNGDVRHALRPDGVRDGTGARPTLCGARAHWVRRPFRPGLFVADWPSARTCQTCARIVARFPPARTLDPPSDLALMTALVARTRADYVSGRDLRPAVAELLALAGRPGGAARGTAA